MDLLPFPMFNNLYCPPESGEHKEFEKKYIQVRQTEKRVYSDEELGRLPDVPATHPHAGEWKIRKISAFHLVHYLESRNRPQHLLEVGCGNGWLSHELSRIPACRVVGMDINLVELKQAARVFPASSKLKFVYGDPISGILSDLRFDAVVLAACIQYFPSITRLLEILRALCLEGEIHILDSPFYKKEDLAGARQRTVDYYQSLGFPEMSEYYHHHSLAEIDPLPYRIMPRPGAWKKSLLGRSNPFPWICIPVGPGK
jgi:ubiquinone/menaquinone biosynthesis C-methylase UbiE